MDLTTNSVASDFDFEELDYKKVPVHTEILKDSTSDSPDYVEMKRKNWFSENNAHKEYKFEHAISVFDVAAYILKKKGPMTTMKLQKLVYYTQAWSLVWDEEPIFKENIEAWANGPVVKELFNYHRGQYMISSVLVGNLELLNDKQKETIDAVIDYYGDKSSQWLSDLTHMEDPWRLSRVGIPEMQRGNRVISLDLLSEYYGSIPPEE